MQIGHSIEAQEEVTAELLDVIFMAGPSVDMAMGVIVCITCARGDPDHLLNKRGDVW